jgi:hypothetical protein
MEKFENFCLQKWIFAVFAFLPTARSAVGLVITLSHFHSYYLIKLVKVAKSCKGKHDDLLG